MTKYAYLNALNNCDQDVIDTLCIIDCVNQETRKDFPDIRMLYQKSDNAGCYAGNLLSFAQYDYYEPQCEKDQADRDSAVNKKALTCVLK